MRQIAHAQRILLNAANTPETRVGENEAGGGAVIRRLRVALAIQRRNSWCQIQWRLWLLWRCLTMSDADLVWCERLESDEVGRDVEKRQ